MKKRILSLLLASIMVVSVCACGNGAGEAVSNETREQVENYVPTYPIVEEPITITALLVGEDMSVSDTRILWDEVAKYTNIHIEWINIDSEALTTRLASNEWPDIFATNIGQKNVYDFGILGGRFVNYLDYLDIMPNFKAAIEEYPEQLAYGIQLNGELYNLYRIVGNAATSTGCRPHYRKDVLAAAGVTEEPKTIEEFYDALVKCRDYYGTAPYIHEQNEISSYIQSLFGAFGDLTQLEYSVDETGTIIFPRATEQYKAYVKFLNKLYEEGLMHKEYLTLERATIIKLAQSGTVPFFTQAAAAALTLEDLNGDWDNLGTLAPFTSEMDPTPELSVYIDYSQEAGMYINKDSEYVEEICKMLDIAYAREEVVPGSNLRGVNFNSGPEFESWTDNGDGTYTEICPEGYTSRSTWLSTAYHWNNGFGLSDDWSGMYTSTPGNTQARQQGYLEKIHPYMVNESVKVSLLRFNDDEQYIIENKYGEIKTYYKQMEAEFVSGAIDIDAEWDNFQAKLKEMGIDEVTATIQTAYTRTMERVESFAAGGALN